MVLTRGNAFRVVFNLRTPTSASEEDVGTRIFINKTDQDLFLVTASHVAKSCNINTKVILSDQNGNSKTLNLLILILSWLGFITQLLMCVRSKSFQILSSLPS